jgi:hypothetical protein
VRLGNKTTHFDPRLEHMGTPRHCAEVLAVIALQHEHQDAVAVRIGRVLPWVRKFDAHPLWCPGIRTMRTLMELLVLWRRTVDGTPSIGDRRGRLRVFCVCHAYAPLAPEDVLANLKRCNSPVFERATTCDPQFLAKWVAAVRPDVDAGRQLACICLVYVLSEYMHVAACLGDWVMEWLRVTACTPDGVVQPFAAKVLWSWSVKDSKAVCAPNEKACTCHIGSVMYALSLVPLLHEQEFHNKDWVWFLQKCGGHRTVDFTSLTAGAWARSHGSRVVMALLSSTPCVRTASSVCQCRTHTQCLLETSRTLIYLLMQPPCQYELPASFYSAVCSDGGYNVSGKRSARQELAYMLVLNDLVPDAYVTALLNSDSMFPFRRSVRQWSRDMGCVLHLLARARVQPHSVIVSLLRRMHQAPDGTFAGDMSKYLAYSQRWSTPRGLWLTCML